MWPFTHKAVVDDETATWHIDNFAWLIRRFGGSEGLTHSKLILPRPGFFVTDDETGHAFAQRIFDQTKGYCGMSDWQVDLVADDNPLAEQAAPSLAMVAAQKHALATFGIAGNRIVISYVPALLKRPDQLIATFAHELAHYLLASAKEAPPCAEDEREFLTDLAAVYLGFGCSWPMLDFNMNPTSTVRCKAGASRARDIFRKPILCSHWRCFCK